MERKSLQIQPSQSPRFDHLSIINYTIITTNKNGTQPIQVIELIKFFDLFLNKVMISSSKCLLLWAIGAFSIYFIFVKEPEL